LTLPGHRPRRIGLYGGSFDPVHQAHLALARSALHDLPLDELRWVPAGEPWQKAHRLAPAEDRLAMLERALADPADGDARYRIEPCELHRAGPSYTIDTVEALQRAEPDAHWFLLIGQDQHAGLHTWHRWRELLDRVTLAVAVRTDVPPRAVDPAVARHTHRTLSMPPMAVSSTRLRQLAAAGAPLGDLVPPAVAGYIESRRLYRDGPTDPTATTLRS
jgi:nicotinate-nucleotide adenylyltransferase